MTLHPTVLRDLAADRAIELRTQAHRTSAPAAVPPSGIGPAWAGARTRLSAALGRTMLRVGWTLVEGGLRLRGTGRLPRTARG